MYKISVICPVYNSEQYISRTIKSIINQTLGFENIELILVDDCSTDSSCEIINDFVEKYENILLFENETNHGFPGFGRNLGMKKSNAEFIMFIDNDDEYEPDFCEKMYDLISSEDLDLISTNYNIIKKTHIEKMSIFNLINDFDEQEGNIKYIDLNKLFYLKGSEIWCKIFKRSIIKNNNLKFIENGLNEDTIFLYEYYHYANRIAFIDYYGYKWYRDGENLSYYTPKSTYSFLKSFHKMYDLIDGLYENVNWNRLFRYHIEWSLIRISFSHENKNQLEDMIKKLYEFEKMINFDSYLNYWWLSIINKLLLKRQFFIVKISLMMMRKVKNLMDKIKN